MSKHRWALSQATTAFTHDKLHCVRICDIKLVTQFFLLRQLEWFRLWSARNLLTAGQLNLRTDYSTILETVLWVTLVVGDDEMDMVEDVGGSVFIQEILEGEQRKGREREGRREREQRGRRRREMFHYM